MSYGSHQEAAARALAELVTSRSPIESGEAELILQCRRQVLLTLGERAWHLGYRGGRSRPSRAVTMAQIVDQPLWQLGHITDQLPRPQLPDVAPSNLLRPSPVTDTAVLKAWRSAARHLFLATSELQRAERQPWLMRPAPGWYAIADLADCVAALVAIDGGLERAGVLERSTSPNITERLLIATDVGRLARLWGTDPVVNAAGSSVQSLVCDGDAPIILVRTTADVVRAQQRLAAMVRSVQVNVDPRAIEDRPGVKIARVLAAGQTRLALQLAAWSEATPSSGGLAVEFRDRARRYRQLHAATVRVIDVEPRRSTAPLIQQAELLNRFSRVVSRPDVDNRFLADVNEISHQLAVSLGKSLRREAVQRRTIMECGENGLDLPVPRPITSSRNSFYLACRSLSDEPPPVTTAPNRNDDRQRRRLQRCIRGVSVPLKYPPRRMPTPTQ